MVAVSCGIDATILVWSLDALQAGDPMLESSFMSSTGAPSESRSSSLCNTSVDGIEATPRQSGNKQQLPRNATKNHIRQQPSIFSMCSSGVVESSEGDLHSNGTYMAQESEGNIHVRRTLCSTALCWIVAVAQGVYKLAIAESDGTMSHRQAAREIRLLLERVDCWACVSESAIEDALEAADFGEDERLCLGQFEYALTLMVNKDDNERHRNWALEGARVAFQLEISRSDNPYLDTLTYGAAICALSSLLQKAGYLWIISCSELETLFAKEDGRKTEEIGEAGFVRVMNAVLERIEAVVVYEDSMGSG
jgi:hypothetical protein